MESQFCQVFFPEAMRGEDLEKELSRSGGTRPDLKGFVSLKESKELWEKCPRINDVPWNLLCTRRSSGLLWQWRSRAYTTAPFFGRSKHLNEKNSRKKEDEPTWHWPVKSSRAGWVLSPPHWGAEGHQGQRCQPVGGAERSHLLKSGQCSGRYWLAPEEPISMPLLLQSANRPFKGVMS